MMSSNTMANDPYQILAESTKRLAQPVTTLLSLHDQFVLQNVSILNHVSTMTNLKTSIESAANSEDKTEGTENRVEKD